MPVQTEKPEELETIADIEVIKKLAEKYPHAAEEAQLLIEKIKAPVTEKQLTPEELAFEKHIKEHPGFTKVIEIDGKKYAILEEVNRNLRIIRTVDGAFYFKTRGERTPDEIDTAKIVARISQMFPSQEDYRSPSTPVDGLLAQGASSFDTAQTQELLDMIGRERPDSYKRALEAADLVVMKRQNSSPAPTFSEQYN